MTPLPFTESQKGRAPSKSVMPPQKPSKKERTRSTLLNFKKFYFELSDPIFLNSLSSLPHQL